jgi:hypothetical protein
VLLGSLLIDVILSRHQQLQLRNVVTFVGQIEVLGIDPCRD